jgi:hypothetical protein
MMCVSCPVHAGLSAHEQPLQLNADGMRAVRARRKERSARGCGAHLKHAAAHGETTARPRAAKDFFLRAKKCLHFFPLFVTQIAEKFESLRSDQRDDTLVEVSDGWCA